MVVLGSLGASCGFLWTWESPTGREQWIDRGIPPSEAETWKTYLPRFIRDLQPPPPQSGGPLSFFRPNDRTLLPHLGWSRRPNG